ncbi:uncharacterized protein MELLADRAFT_71208 [Melampsora larici-populina 98AG31]|uniref:Uncharacterized protein n=1 Tax=Melampsora larici-populina (strain 98AG31 / pathotype 3-4-7) TaxID=747676 RepID=F4RD99_MELLP|nr:uncharacterized protein MELLADRAFT_71208 [Melampsora larici-populina 98AG31]EGG09364.1 hypothetical protein MELLADRAFT_71208 [Melampsora larici-populina 98AG31]
MPATGYSRKAVITSAEGAPFVTYTCDEGCDSTSRMPVRHCCRIVQTDIQFTGCEGPIPIVNGA